MTVIANTVFIARSPEDVFDALSDPRGELEWNPQVEVMEQVTDGPIGVGTVFRAKWKKSKLMRMEFTRFDRPRGWTYLNGGPIEVELSIDLTPEGDGTRLDARFDATARGAAKLFFPIFLKLMRREEQQNMRLIKAYCESR